jgi:hypothetical protein
MIIFMLYYLVKNYKAWFIIKVTLLKSGKEFSHGLNTDKHGFLKSSVKIRVSSVANKKMLPKLKWKMNHPQNSDLYPVSSIVHPASFILHLLSCIFYLASCILHLVSCILYPVSCINQ